jgi:hypothetical protein
VTTKVLQKAVWAGANNSSFSLASEALAELAGVRLSPKQIRRLAHEVGRVRVAERDAAVEQLKSMSLPARRAGSQAHTPPALAVISMDGGRYQRRDNFRSGPSPGDGARREEGTHWRETKVGCLLSMASEVHACDPMPDLPEWLLTSAAIAELAKIAEKPPSETRTPHEQTPPAASALCYEPPKLVSREVLASSADAESFGWQLEARAWQLSFPAAARQVFVADGLAINWTIQRRHFPKATPVLDLMHALSYAWSAAAATEGRASYQQWAQWIWQGKVSQVIAALTEHQQRLGAPPDNADVSDARQRVHRALTYYTNNQPRMDYPHYRQQGLPLTSSHIESTVKQINQRIKGTEKFWRQDSSETVLQLRADTLSDTEPLTLFWHRWQAQQTGANRYHAAA